MPKQYGLPIRKHINELERMQRMAMKMVSELEGLQYEERLREMNLQTPEQRRERGGNTNLQIME